MHVDVNVFLVTRLTINIKGPVVNVQDHYMHLYMQNTVFSGGYTYIPTS